MVMNVLRARTALGSAAVMLTMAIAVVAASRQIPAGPSVQVSDGWYHVDTCPIARGRQAPSMTLSDALRKSNGPCPICEPLDHQPEWAAFVKSHGATIKEEVRAKAEAEAAEKKRLADEAEAARLKRLADLEAERKSRETATVPRLSEAQVRDIAKAAVAEAAGDPLQFQTRFRARVREVSPDYSGPQVVHGSAALRVLVAGPVGKFELAMIDQLHRKVASPVAAWSVVV